MSLLQEIEQKITDTLKAQIPDLRTVKGYEGDFMGRTPEEILGLLPAVLVTYENADFERRNKIIEQNFKWSVIVATQNFRKKKARQDIHDLLQKIREALDELRLDEYEMHPLSIAREHFVYRDYQIVCYAQEYFTKILWRK